ncbi:iron-containing redox enzyme family protein [Aeromicrobium chenweiae]|uniref:Iron-containing redox enzyme family protein n=1 Tax=Aeromicrobium chenweiae TaxID=2079793 RepID=A0A2S0WIL0_9ACTN|nr:iron-containing redox enzyme family protein [Aeromicrobium chenweiae]AWB91114.1 iron-containing redox enzyme family protein [Aeromicrobium chenweiae]TGN31634.1 iron-containing redox enzyme family protein [Aeromicrobium chenweiae]
MLTPKGRGSLSETVFESMRASSPSWDDALRTLPDDDEDLQITLWALYELHYRGFEDVDDAREWQPELIELRRSLESSFEQQLRDRAPDTSPEGEFAETLFSFVADHDGPSLAKFVHRDATNEQALELLRLRSIYHLKESDPSAWLVPRLGYSTKAALMELQFDEYGGGDPTKLHAALFARGMDDCGLRNEYGAYIDDVPLEVLEENNAMSLFGLNRRLRGASLGHLAAFEITSSIPSRRIAQGFERLGLPASMIGYYTEHVEADAVHEQLAVRTICGSLLQDEPGLRDDVFFGAFTCLDLEDRFAHRMLKEWAA